MTSYIRFETKIFYDKCYLALVRNTSRYKIAKLIKLKIFLASRDSGKVFIIIIIYFYNYYYV